MSHIHASENGSGPLGRGHLPFAEIIFTLKEMNYQGYVMIEGFGYIADEKQSPDFKFCLSTVPVNQFPVEI